VNAEVVPVYMLDRAIGELRRRAGGRECLPVGDAVDVLLELREAYGVDLETADYLLWFLGYREGRVS
jgi:hypothetical protein